MDASTSSDQPSGDSAEKTITVIGFGRRVLATLTDGVLLATFTFIAASSGSLSKCLIHTNRSQSPN